MQQQTTSMTQLTKLGHVIFLLLLLLGFASPNVLAKSPSAIKAEKGEVQRYLHGKYKIKEILIQEREDAHSGLGRWRSMDWGGDSLENDITPPAIAAQGDRATKDPRVIAKAFFAEEADLLGITPISEMKEEIRGLPATTDERGHTHLSYYHFLNGLRLDGTWTAIHIGSSSNIYSLYSNVVQISEELLKAVKKPGLPQTEIRRSIKKDLIAHGLDPDKVTHIEDEKYAIPTSPYVVWEGKRSTNPRLAA